MQSVVGCYGSQNKTQNSENDLLASRECHSLIKSIAEGERVRRRKGVGRHRKGRNQKGEHPSKMNMVPRPAV